MKAAADPALVASIVEALVAAGAVSPPAAPPVPPRSAEDSILLSLRDAIGWIESVRRKVDDLVFTAQDATSPEPDYSRQQLRERAHEDGIEAMRACRFAAEEIHAAIAKVKARKDGAS